MNIDTVVTSTSEETQFTSSPQDLMAVVNESNAFSTMC